MTIIIKMDKTLLDRDSLAVIIMVSLAIWLGIADLRPLDSLRSLFLAMNMNNIPTSAYYSIQKMIVHLQGMFDFKCLNINF